MWPSTWSGFGQRSRNVASISGQSLQRLPHAWWVSFEVHLHQWLLTVHLRQVIVFSLHAHAAVKKGVPLFCHQDRFLWLVWSS